MRLQTQPTAPMEVTELENMYIELCSSAQYTERATSPDAENSLRSERQIVQVLFQQLISNPCQKIPNQP